MVKQFVRVTMIRLSQFFFFGMISAAITKRTRTCTAVLFMLLSVMFSVLRCTAVLFDIECTFLRGTRYLNSFLPYYNYFNSGIIYVVE